ncbi:sensor histidine kinase [Virgibacillus kimchii]
MKIKTWLLLSYFIVMLLPLLAAYLLLGWINTYNDEQKVAEHIEVMAELEEVKQVLDQPRLYTPGGNFENVENLAGQNLSIALYNQDGIVIYTSNPSFTSTHHSLGKQQLYEDLYSLEQGYRAYTYKQPVFDNNELTGFFQVQMGREEWVTGVENRGYLVGTIFLLVFSLIYITVIRMVNKKLNRPLTGLMNNMTAFAQGQPVEEKPVKNDEVGKVTEHFYDMSHQVMAARKAVEQEQQAKEYLIASISHDLKTPLTSIKTYAESLKAENDLTPKERSDYRNVIIEKADFMQHMLDDLLTYTLLQSREHDMELVQVDGNEFFDMLVADYEPLGKQKEIAIHALAEVQGMYNVNPKQMTRVADNLVSNAMAHTPENGEIWLAAVSDRKKLADILFDFIPEKEIATETDTVYFIVQNEGKGIPADKLAYVFDPLYQADEARNKNDKSRTGLGLSITKQVIEKHGGNVQIFSKENVGTCVICSLPAIKREGIANE